MLASIFWVIIEREKSFLSIAFSRVSNCQRTRKGLAEYPEAPATQTISPFQSMRIRATFCSASQDKTSKEMLPLPRPAAPYFKEPNEAKNHAFDRERGGDIPASWLKSHARSLVRYYLHPETKFQGGDFDQRGPLKRRHVFALAQQSIGKEADNIEENEFIGEDADPPHYGVELTCH